MTEEQIDFLRFLITEECNASQIDPIEHGACWSWAEKELDESWKRFKDSFKTA